MAYRNPIKTLVIPTGAGPNDQRIVLNGVTGQIEVYGPGGLIVALIDGTGIYAMSGQLADPNSHIRLHINEGLNAAHIELRPPDTNENELFVPADILASFNDETDEAGYLFLGSPVREGLTSPVSAVRMTSRGVNSTRTKLDLIGEDVVVTGDFAIANYGIGSRNPKFKASSLTKTNQAALFDDPDLQWLSVPVGTYLLDSNIVARTSNVANDGIFHWAFSGTATGGLTTNAPSITVAGGINALNTDEAAFNTSITHGLLTTDMRYHSHGILRVTVAGNLIFKFAQSPAAAGTSITIAQNTFATLERIA